MLAIEMDKDRQIYRRRYVGGGVGAFILSSVAPGVSSSYVNGTLEMYFYPASSTRCEFASASYVFGERNLAIEVAFESWSDFRTFMGRFPDNPVFKGSDVTKSTFILRENDLMFRQGLPWSDARRDAYILIQTQPEEMGLRPFINAVEAIADPSYKFRTLQILGSPSYNTLVIVSSEPESFEEEAGGNNTEESKREIVSSLTRISDSIERIRTAPGISDIMVYICSTTLNFYPYDKEMFALKQFLKSI